MRKSCHCGNRRSSRVTAPNAADTSVRTPNITTNEKEAELSTKNGSMLSPSPVVPLVLLDELESLETCPAWLSSCWQEAVAAVAQRGRVTFCPTWPEIASAANSTFTAISSSLCFLSLSSIATLPISKRRDRAYAAADDCDELRRRYYTSRVHVQRTCHMLQHGAVG